MQGNYGIRDDKLYERKVLEGLFYLLGGIGVVFQLAVKEFIIRREVQQAMAAKIKDNTLRALLFLGNIYGCLNGM